MSENTPRNPRNRNIVNIIDGDTEPDTDVTQVGHVGYDGDREPRTDVRNEIRGNVSGNARVLQAGNIASNIDL